MFFFLIISTRFIVFGCKYGHILFCSASVQICIFFVMVRHLGVCTQFIWKLLHRENTAIILHTISSPCKNCLRAIR